MPTAACYAINPEFGFFGVAPGTNERSNPNAMHTLDRNTVFTNTALTDDGDVWWEDITDEPPAHLIDWQRRVVDARRRPPRRAPELALLRARVAVPVDRARMGGPGRRADLGVPVRRPPRHHRAARVRVERLAPRRARRRDHGLGEDRRRRSAGSASCAATRSRCCPFCGYNMGDYIAHWLSMTERTDEANAPRDLRRELVPQGRRTGKFLWPGFGENSRVLEWIFRRLDGDASGADDADRRRAHAPPTSTSTGSTCPPTDVAAALTVDPDEWRAELPGHPGVLRRARRAPARRAARGARRTSSVAWLLTPEHSSLRSDAPSATVDAGASHERHGVRADPDRSRTGREGRQGVPGHRRCRRLRQRRRSLRRDREGGVRLARRPRQARRVARSRRSTASPAPSPAPSSTCSRLGQRWRAGAARRARAWRASASSISRSSSSGYGDPGHLPEPRVHRDRREPGDGVHLVDEEARGRRPSLEEQVDARHRLAAGTPRTPRTARSCAAAVCSSVSGAGASSSASSDSYLSA